MLCNNIFYAQHLLRQASVLGRGNEADLEQVGCRISPVLILEIARPAATRVPESS